MQYALTHGANMLCSAAAILETEALMERHEHPVASDCWHIRAVRLPFGEQVEEWWVCDGILHDEPVPGAIDLPGGWVLPGLVDAHAHLTLDFNGTGLPDGSEALIVANCRAQCAA